MMHGQQNIKLFIICYFVLSLAVYMLVYLLASYPIVAMFGCYLRL